MRKMSLWLLTLGFLSACGSGTDQSTASETGPEREMNTMPGVDNADGVCAALTDESAWTELDTRIEADTTLSCARVYVLVGMTFVTNGATLTIEAGTTVLGNEASALVITQDGYIVTNGTAEAPVVLTSVNAVSPNDRSAGDWGGLILLGSAPINVEGGTNLMEGIDISNRDVPDNGSRYGGTDVASDCGRLNYTRVEFAGFELTLDNELNGVTLGGCGTDTQIDYLQVHEGLDDGIEIFGGAPNLKHIVLSNIEDDSLDWDQGFHGNIQFMLIVQKGSDADNGIEADNDGDNHDAMPRSNPTLANVTMIGSEAGSHGMVLRRGTYANIKNTLVTGFPRFGLDIRGDAGAAAILSGEMSITNSLFFNNGNDGPTDDLAGSEEGEDDDDNALNEAVFFAEAAQGNQVGVDPLLTDFIPDSESPVSETNLMSLTDFFVATDYIGAFEPNGADWTEGWTSFETK
jgi:hypothetical protein